MVLKKLLKNIKKDKIEEVTDPTAWLIDNSISQFIILHTFEIKFMCLLGYTYFAGYKVFSYAPATASTAYKFVNQVLMSTGGGILVPIFLNGTPVPLAYDYYIIAILITFGIHHYCPVMRDVYKLSSVFKFVITVSYEIIRAGVVCTMTAAAAKKIPPSMVSFPLFGPIICGCIGGCGAAFFPLNKGLEPIKDGLASPMFTALLGAAGYHIYLSTSLSEGCMNAPKKAHLHVVSFFILVGVLNAFGLNIPRTKKEVSVAKKES